MVLPLCSPLPLLPPFSRGELGRKGNRRLVIHGNGGKQRTPFMDNNGKTRDWRVSRKHKPQTSKNASLCEQALWEKNSKEREGNGEGGGNLGGNRPFRFSLSLVPRSTKGLFTERIPRNLLVACRLCHFVAFLNYFIANERCMFTTRRKFTLTKINANFPKVRFTLACAQTKLNSG